MDLLTNLGASRMEIIESLAPRVLGKEVVVAHYENQEFQSRNTVFVVGVSIQDTKEEGVNLGELSLLGTFGEVVFIAYLPVQVHTKGISTMVSSCNGTVHMVFTPT